MSNFNDFEPEDEYDASDALHVRLTVIARVAAAAADDDELTRARRLALVARLLGRIVNQLEDDDG